MNTNKIEYCTLVYELYRSILAKLDSYIASGADAAAIEELTIDTVNLEKALIDCRLVSGDMPDTIEKINDLLAGDAISQLPMLRSLLLGISNGLVDNICMFIEKEISPALHLDKKLSDMLLDLAEVLPHISSNVFNFIFAVLDRSSFVNAKRAFDLTLTVVAQHPDILGGTNGAHPGYVFKDSPQRIFEKCPICGGSGEPYFRAFPFRVSNGVYPHLPAKLWMRCQQCGDIYAYHHPEEFLALCENMELLQPNKDNYLHTIRNTNSVILSIWADILDSLRKYTDGKKLLEVGVGSGELLAVAQELGYDTSAVEIVPEDAQRVADMLDIPVWNCDFLRYTSEDKYSVIIMGDVIEHVTDPEAALKNAHSLLEDNGVLWISTPNYNSAFSKLRKFEDVMWHIANHITYFSYDGFRKLAEKCGFDVVDYKVSKRYNGSMELVLIKK